MQFIWLFSEIGFIWNVNKSKMLSEISTEDNGKIITYLRSSYLSTWAILGGSAGWPNDI